MEYAVKTYDDLQANMRTIGQQLIEAKKNERAYALKEVKRVYKKFGFTAGMRRESLTNG